MAFAAGTRFGVYEIGGIIGVGGMGEVYRATDDTLGREVAIKVLPDSFAADADRAARFEREAKTLASLNHTNIGQIFGLERRDGTTALVMELVEGPTLAHRLMQGPIPVDEALNIAVQIADALEAAHERGIVHRDLKPANIKLRPDGTVKVLDFGIAKVLAPPNATSGRQTPAPFTTPAMTELGVILGTAAYMSPEQARGKPVDERADIWAFGCVLYEMLTGQAAFGGEDVTMTLARVLERNTDVTSMPGTISPAVRHTIKLCLEKDPKRRISDIRDVRLALEGAFESDLSRTGGSSSPRPGWRRATPYALTLLIGVGLVALAGAMFWPKPAAPPVSRFLVTPPATAPLTSLGGFDIAVSPDGRRFAYLAEGASANEVALYLRDLDSLEARLLATGISSAAGSANPFFSADGSWIGFWSPGVGIMRVAVGGGPLTKVVDDPAAFRGAVGARDGSVIYATVDGLHRVSAGGGGRRERIAPEPEAGAVPAGPTLLPGERAVVFMRANNDGRTYDVMGLNLATGEQTVLIQDGQVPTYTVSGHLVFVRGATLMAAPFDAAALAVTGEPVALFEGVRTRGGQDAADYALSANGTLVYVPAGGDTALMSQIVWVDREGRIAERAQVEPVENPRDPRLSPDGSRLVLTKAGSNVWIYDLSGRPPIPLADTGRNRRAVWSPDGRRIAFATNRDGSYGSFRPYVLPADGSVVDPVPLSSGGLFGFPEAWSADGELVVVRATNPTQNDIVAIRPDSDGAPREVVATAANEFGAALSPNGRWLAYVSDRTGGNEVWVKGDPSGIPVRVSSGGGREPVWSRDGRQLFYLQANTLMAVAVETNGEFAFKPAVELFASPYFLASSNAARSYDVGPDGRFLMIEPPEGATDANIRSSIVVVQNWLEELKRLVPTE